MKGVSDTGWITPAGLLLLATAFSADAGSSETFECLIAPSQVIEVRSPVEGLIERISVKRGDAIHKGQVLVELQSAVERSAVDAARFRAQMDGRIATARSRLDFATKKLQRYVELSAENFVAVHVRDEADAEKRLAEAELKDALETRELAKLELRRAEDILNLRRLQSPIDGLVMERLLNVGDIAEAGTGRKPILRIAKIDPLHVEVVLPVSMLNKVQVGRRGELTAEGVNGRHLAAVSTVDRVFDAASGTFGVRLELANPGNKLPAGLRCQVGFLPVAGPASPARRGGSPVQR